MNPRRAIAAILIAVTAPAILSGCGGSPNTAWVKGKLLKGGAPYAPPTGQVVSVTFVGIEIEDRPGVISKSPEPFMADYEDDSGSFTVPGRDGHGIPRGKYRIAVTQKMTREAFASARPKPRPGRRPVARDADLLEDRFGPDRSPIVREIKGSTDLVIDMDQPS